MPAAKIEWRQAPGAAAQLDRAAQDLLIRKARAVQREARRMAPGRMGRRVNAVIVGKHVRVESSHPATMYVIKGTRPHVIRPRTRKVLKFRMAGRTVFAKVVHHPGTKANDFLTKALRTVAARR